MVAKNILYNGSAAGVIQGDTRVQSHSSQGVSHSHPAQSIAFHIEIVERIKLGVIPV